MTTTVDTETRLLAALQQLHTLRAGIGHILKAHDAPEHAALLADLSALVHGAADESLDTAEKGEP
jgi:hypothetical protein